MLLSQNDERRVAEFEHLAPGEDENPDADGGVVHKRRVAHGIEVTFGGEGSPKVGNRAKCAADAEESQADVPDEERRAQRERLVGVHPSATGVDENEVDHRRCDCDRHVFAHPLGVRSAIEVGSVLGHHRRQRTFVVKRAVA